MKNILRMALIAMMATALAAPASSYAQSRGGSHTSSSSSSASRSSGASHSSGSSMSRSSGAGSSMSRGSSAGSVSRSSSSVSRSSSASRPSSSVSRSSYPQSSTATRSSSVSRSTSPQVSRSTSSSATRSAGTVSRSTSTSRPSSSVSRSSGAAATRSATPGRPASSVNGRPGGTSRSSAAARPAAHLDNRGSVRPVERRSGAPRVAPRDRGFIDHHAPSCFYHHGPHYYGYHVHALPPHYHTHWYWGRQYYFCDGLYYRYWNNYYHVCRPPYGIFFDRALYDLELVICDIAFYSTVHRVYNAVNDNNRTIMEQNEIIARNNATIAQQNAAIAQGNVIANESYELAQRLGLVQSYADANTKYYYDDGIFFVLDKSGQYVTIIPPAGAIITELPDDYDTVNLGGEDYYQVDDTIYRVVINNGKACFEVLGQLMN